MRLVTFALLLATVAGAQPKETPPQGGPPKPFNVPVRDTFTLRNGVRVSLIPYGTVPIVSVRAVCDFGNANETADQVWLADMLTALMKEGAGGKSSKELSEAAAAMGGELNTGAGLDSSVASISVLSEFAADAVRLVADVWQRPTLPASELERIRANLLRRLTVERSTPQSLASEAYAKLNFGDHPYGRYYPTEQQLKGYTIDDVKKFYQANAGGKRMRVYIAGRFDPAIRRVITAAFENWAAGAEAAHNIPKLKPERRFLLIDRPGAAQSTLRVGLRIGADPSSPDYVAMEVMDSILGGSFGSRITSNIREQKGYTYSPFSTVATNYRTAVWTESADVTTKVTADALKEIFLEIERLRREPPSAEELKNIQSYLSGIYVLRNSSAGGIASQFSFVDEQGLSDDFIRTYVQKVNGVSRADVQRMAEKYLDPAKMTVVVVGDKSQIEASLKPYQP